MGIRIKTSQFEIPIMHQAALNTVTCSQNACINELFLAYLQGLLPTLSDGFAYYFIPAKIGIKIL